MCRQICRLSRGGDSGVILTSYWKTVASESGALTSNAFVRTMYFFPRLQRATSQLPRSAPRWAEENAILL